MDELNLLRVSYCRADRCWQSNNLKHCAQICSKLTKQLNDFAYPVEYEKQLAELKNLVWFLKIKCLSEEYHINESFLLNEDDIQHEDQIRTFNAPSSVATAAPASRGSITKRLDCRPTTAQMLASTNRKLNGAMRLDSRAQKTGMLTGKMPTRSLAMNSGSANTSYRPLTTSLTATQTAFSRSTRPLLKYSTCVFMSKPIYEYLYNAQNITNICPDHRQCLEYLNLVQSAQRSQAIPKENTPNHTNFQLISLSNEPVTTDFDKLGAFWSLASGVCYFHLKMHKEAEQFFRASLKADKKCLDPYLWLIKVYLRMNQASMVLNTCDEASLNSRNAIIHNWKSRVQSLLGDSHAAHMSLRESLNFCPTNIEALANVGHYCFYGDKLELALKCFDRIYQLSMNSGSSGPQAAGSDGLLSSISNNSSSAELFNNMALCHFQCGNYAKVMPLFDRAFLNSASKQVTSNIWYNISFVPLNFGAKELAIACLQLALINDSQNEEATNNLGVLRYNWLIDDPMHYKNRQEYWSSSLTRTTPNQQAELANGDDRSLQAVFDDAETYFKASEQLGSDRDNIKLNAPAHPEMVYNLAILKRKRGQLMESINLCELYLQSDQNNYTIQNILEEINSLISHDC